MNFWFLCLFLLCFEKISTGSCQTKDMIIVSSSKMGNSTIDRTFHKIEENHRNKNKKRGQGHKKKAKMMTLLGKDYQPTYMSNVKPKRNMLSIHHKDVNLPGRWSEKDLNRQIDLLNITKELQDLSPDLLPFESKVREYMIKRATCPIEFRWKDLGKDFWPRYVREGTCIDRKSHCSFPTGMNCVPSTTTTVYVLKSKCEKNLLVRHVRSIINDTDRTSVMYHPQPRHARRSIINDTDRTSVMYHPQPVVPYLPGKEPGKGNRKKQKEKKNCVWIKDPVVITIDCFCGC